MSRIITEIPTDYPTLGTIAQWRDQAENLLVYAEPISRVGLYVSLAIIYAWFGGMKFTAYEAEGLVPLNAAFGPRLLLLPRLRRAQYWAADRPQISEPDLLCRRRSSLDRALRHDPQLDDLDAGCCGAGAWAAGDHGRAGSVPPQGRRPVRRLLLDLCRLAEGRSPPVSSRSSS